MDYEKNCPIGISNSKEIEKLQDKFAMVIENIEKNISNLGNTMEKKFNELNKKIDDIDEKIETYNKTIPQKVNEIVENKLKIGVFNVVKWISITAGGVIVVSIVTRALTGM